MDAMVEGPRSLDEIAAETSALLYEVGVQLALAEAGTGGEIADYLSGTSEGRAILTHSRIYGAPEELAAGLRVSPAKVSAFGAISAMVGAEAAAELIDTYEGGWGLVVMTPGGNPAAAPGVPNEGTGSSLGLIALGTPSTTILQQGAVDRIVEATLELLARQAESRRETSRKQVSST